MDRGREEDGDGIGSGEPPAADWNAEFTAIVSGISGSMQWSATPAEVDEEATRAAEDARRDAARGIAGGFAVAPDDIWQHSAAETPEERRRRRELRRQERAVELAAFQQAQSEIEAARAADTERYEPPPPPPLPKPRRSTVGGLVLMFFGIIILVAPALVPASLEFTLVLSLALILGGVAVIMAGMRRYRRFRRPPGDDGAAV